jgi:hypothetical protein
VRAVPEAAQPPGAESAEGPPAGKPDSDPEAVAESDRGPASEEGSGTSGPVEAIAQGAVATAEQVRSRVEEVRTGVEARADEVLSRADEVRTEVESRVESIDLERLAGLWPAIVDQVKQSGSEFLSAAFVAARPLAVDSERSTVEIGFPPSAAFNKRKAEGKENRERFSEAVRTIVGRRLNPSYVLLDEEPGAPPSVPTPIKEGVDEGELVDRIKAEFDAEELIEHPDEPENRDNPQEAEG